MGSITVTDTLPTGLTFVSGSGSFWSCGAVAQVVTCTYSQVLSPGANAFQLSLTVNVNSNAPVGTNSITNSATASGGGASNSPTANDPTTVLGPAVLSISKTHTGSFNVGQQGALYNITVSNGAAAGPTVGSITVTDTLPTGLTFVSGSGNFWSCGAVAQVVTCTYSQVLSPGANAFQLSLTVNVNSNAPVGTNSITNSATASGGGASNSPTANDPTTVLGPAVLSISKTHTGSFNVGQQGALYNITRGQRCRGGADGGVHHGDRHTAHGVDLCIGKRELLVLRRSSPGGDMHLQPGPQSWRQRVPAYPHRERELQRTGGDQFDYQFGDGIGRRGQQQPDGQRSDHDYWAGGPGDFEISHWYVQCRTTERNL